MAKHTQHARFRSIGTLLMLLGAGISTLGAELSLNASLTDQGSYLGTTQASAPMLMARETVFPAAMESAGPSFGMIALGMLIMLIGIGLHGLYVLRSRDERPVPVKIRKQKAPQKEARKSRRQAEVIWIERTIRF